MCVGGDRVSLFSPLSLSLSLSLPLLTFPIYTSSLFLPLFLLSLPHSFSLRFLFPHSLSLSLPPFFLPPFPVSLHPSIPPSLSHFIPPSLRFSLPPSLPPSFPPSVPWPTGKEEEELTFKVALSLYPTLAPLQTDIIML